MDGCVARRFASGVWRRELDFTARIGRVVGSGGNIGGGSEETKKVRAVRGDVSGELRGVRRVRRDQERDVGRDRAVIRALPNRIAVWSVEEKECKRRTGRDGDICDRGNRGKFKSERVRRRE